MFLSARRRDNLKIGAPRHPVGGQYGSVDVAGVLLTGGASRRMGRDKATARLDLRPELGVPTLTGPTLAGRTARLLQDVASVSIEVGPGHTALAHVTEDPPGGGPLAGLAAGWALLSELGWAGPVLAVATDLPFLTAAALGWLAAFPAPGSVVPTSRGRVQPLCARYCPADLDLAAGLVRQGRTAMKDLLAAAPPLVVGEEVWVAALGTTMVFDDVDTPEQLERARRLGAR